jgi:hypothetical protein
MQHNIVITNKTLVRAAATVSRWWGWCEVQWCCHSKNVLGQVLSEWRAYLPPKGNVWCSLQLRHPSSSTIELYAFRHSPSEVEQSKKQKTSEAELEISTILNLDIWIHVVGSLWFVVGKFVCETLLVHGLAYQTLFEIFFFYWTS